MEHDYLLGIIKELFKRELFETHFNYMNCEVTSYINNSTNSINIRLSLVEIQLAYNFDIREEYIYINDFNMLSHMIKSHIFNFIQQISIKIRSRNYNSPCTKELILEKYFDSYAYSKTNLIGNNHFEYIINNPNIILRKGAGHTISLAAFMNEPTYKYIIDETLVLFNNNRKFSEILSYGVNHRKVINLHNSFDALRGIAKKFFIFNSFQDCFKLLDKRILSELHYSDSHFIILGE